jgi:hypothetical protein
MTLNIPYVISEAHPDYKRPYLLQDFGVVHEKMFDTFFIEKVAEFICYRTNSNDIKSVDDITKFWYNYFDDYYMDNSPWDARIFINGEWENVTPTDIQIFECIQRMKMEEKEEEQEENTQNEDEEGVAFELTEEEKDIQERMRNFLEKELDKSDFEAMSKMNKNEQIIFIFTQCLLHIPSEKYKTNRELLCKFFNIILKYTQQEISILTEKMTENHSNKTSEYLTHLMNVYGSLLEYNTIFNNFNSFKV